MLFQLPRSCRSARIISRYLRYDEIKACKDVKKLMRMEAYLRYETCTVFASGTSRKWRPFGILCLAPQICNYGMLRWYEMMQLSACLSDSVGRHDLSFCVGIAALNFFKGITPSQYTYEPVFPGNMRIAVMPLEGRVFCLYRGRRACAPPGAWAARCKC